MNITLPHSTRWLALAAMLNVPFMGTGYSQATYSQAVLADEPLLYWNFDEEEPGPRQLIPVPPVADENTLLPTGNVTKISHTDLASGLRLGQAAAFDGASFLRSPGPLRAGAGVLSGAWAVELWVQSLGTNEGTYPLNFGSIPGGDNSPAVIYHFGGTPVVEIFGGGGGRTGPSGPVFDDQEWHHILLVYFGDGIDGVAARADIYLDGELYTNLDPLSKRLSLAGLMVGAGLPDLANAFTGHIDEVAVYNLGRLEDEGAVETWAADLVDRHRSTAMAATGPTYSSVVEGDKPLLYWTFDEETPESAAIVADPSAIEDENRLLPMGAPFQVTHEEIGSDLKLGRAAELDGNSFFYTTPLWAGLEPNQLGAPYAVELWFQSLSSNSGTYLLNFGPNGGNSPALIYNFGGYETFLEIFGGGSRTGQTGPSFTDDKWHHVFIVNYGDGSNGVANRLDIYFDRVLFKSVAPGYLPLALDQLFTGAALLNKANAFTGRLDELAIYDLSSFADEAAVEAKATAMVNSHFEAAGAVPSGAEVVITVPPASTTASLGQTVTFSVTAHAVNSDENLTYQWFKDGESIVGAFESTYTIPEIILSDVGTHSYSVRVAAGGVFTVSEPAVLTVAAPPAPTPTAYSAQVLSDQPLLYWNFDEVTGPALQRSPAAVANELTPTVFAGRDQHSRLGSGLSLGHTADFQGTGHFKGLLDTELSELNGPFGFELWFQSTAANPGTYLANFGNYTVPGNDNAPAVIFNFGGFENHMEFFLNGLRTGLDSPLLEDEEWHHVFFAFYGNEETGLAPTLEIYFDGEVTEIYNTIAWRVNLAGLVVGAALPSGVNSFTGRIDEIALYDLSSATDENALRSRVQSMIASHRAAAFGAVVPTAPPVLNISTTGDNVTLTWSNADGFVLQESTSLSTNSWTPVAGATSPYTVPTPVTGQKFYRLARP